MRLILGLFLSTLLCALPVEAGNLPVDKIKLPPGFKISIFNDHVAGARSLCLTPGGTLFVSTRDQGLVYAIPDATRSTEAHTVFTIARGLFWPNGVAFKNGSLYVAEVNRVIRFDNIESRLKDPPKPVVVTDRFPSDKSHGWKFIAFGPDGLLYVPIGAPCNICNAGDPYASITRMKPDGSDFQIFARGVRNTVGFDWHPITKVLWFTDNGRDWLGDNEPPDELNMAPHAGMHFGYPFCHAGDIADPEFGKLHKCSEFTPPVMKLGPHVASLGMRFYTGKMFPKEYANQIFIAEHGSWNRSVPIGYRVSLVRCTEDRATSYETFAQGWLQGDKPWGRPVDICVMPDGALLVSDDKAGAIYRISYSK